MTDPQAEWVRFLAKPGAKTGTLCVVANGKTFHFMAEREQMMTAIESAAESLREMDKPHVD